jgi:hypothetical protein
MADKNETLKLIHMNEVEAQEIDWLVILWYPYIPYGKITVIQGDPGDGKTTEIIVISIPKIYLLGIDMTGNMEARTGCLQIDICDRRPISHVRKPFYRDSSAI